MNEPLLSIEDLRAHIGTARGTVRAVDGVSLSVGHGEALGVVGESGSGKSIMVRALLGLLPARSGVSGSVRFAGRDLLSLSKRERLDVLGKQIAMVFQDPGRALNPVVRIERQLTESMRRHLGVSAAEARERALGLLREVGVSDPERRLRNYPHELSGGMRQRVMIAIALACEPRLLIADEPTTALDVTIQRQILDLIRRIQQERTMAMMLISHDLAVVAGRTDRVAVLYAGRLAEVGSTKAVFGSPRHRYTEALLAATPSLETERHARLRIIDGSLPDPVAPPPGCRFAPRCGFADAGCRTEAPPPARAGDDHVSTCRHPVDAGLVHD
ncbi:ABC transporter ATP-binding protein [Amycolatopsis sp. YIM 10]|uniref:ABC transporter ATP-binding protein n=1 Tax=Amycolatopsis sp. YIM 10 TaxID=2653857 RepID=UPI00129017CE|nr:ABC transporter ATP-binding protein [Amycolatopsis sp. YIM 10]QFU92501.1 Oligopeptide transport ATP-binding protein OppD [Amycolatopsis sp. YIM 10]